MKITTLILDIELQPLVLPNTLQDKENILNENKRDTYGELESLMKKILLLIRNVCDVSGKRWDKEDPTYGGGEQA